MLGVCVGRVRTGVRQNMKRVEWDYVGVCVCVGESLRPIGVDDEHNIIGDGTAIARVCKCVQEADHLGVAELWAGVEFDLVLRICGIGGLCVCLYKHIGIK